MSEAQGHAERKRLSSTASGPATRRPGSWEMNLGDEETISPNRQAENAPPDDPNPPAERARKNVKCLANVLADLVGIKLHTQVSMDALMQLAFAACTADVVTWEEMLDLSEKEWERLYNSLSPGQARLLRTLITVHRPRT